MFTDGPSPFQPRRESHSVVVALIVLIAAALGLYVFSERMHADRQRTSLRHQQPLAIPGPQPIPAPQRPVHQAVERNQAPERVHRAPQYEAPPARVTIYLCKSYAGSMFWTSGTCSSQGATIDRIATVPGAMSFQEQVTMASREADAAAALYAAPAPPAAGIVGANAPPAAQVAECMALAERIQALDSSARQPQSGQMQDWIRAERTAAVSRRAALHC